MPPDHGAAVVRSILDNRDLITDWQRELDEMRIRLNDMRAALAAAHPGLAPVALQRGLFSRLPIDAHAVTAMRESHGIYMPADGRINIAGLSSTNLRRFINRILPYLEQSTSAGPFEA
jgi:aromatic-amino-acid transaminase